MIDSASGANVWHLLKLLKSVVCGHRMHRPCAKTNERGIFDHGDLCRIDFENPEARTTSAQQLETRAVDLRPYCRSAAANNDAPHKLVQMFASIYNSSADPIVESGSERPSVASAPIWAHTSLFIQTHTRPVLQSHHC